MGRLDTCYAPVRRSPSNQASLIHAAPRLACVKPVASVHPEPGSNSSLYNIFIYKKRKTYLAEHQKLSFPFQEWRFVLVSLVLQFLSMELCQRTTFLRASETLWTPPQGPLFLVCGCKGTTIPQTTKTYHRFFSKKSTQNIQYLIIIYARARWLSWQKHQLTSYFDSFEEVATTVRK